MIRQRDIKSRIQSRPPLASPPRHFALWFLPFDNHRGHRIAIIILTDFDFLDVEWYFKSVLSVLLLTHCHSGFAFRAIDIPVAKVRQDEIAAGFLGAAATAAAFGILAEMIDCHDD